MRIRRQKLWADDAPERLATGATWLEGPTWVGDRLLVSVIPAGLAFAASLAAKPALVLNQYDGHPTPAGTYLAGCTAFATIYHTSPVGNTAHGGLSADVAQHLQKMAAKVTGH